MLGGLSLSNAASKLNVLTSCAAAPATCAPVCRPGSELRPAAAAKKREDGIPRGIPAASVSSQPAIECGALRAMRRALSSDPGGQAKDLGEQVLDACRRGDADPLHVRALCASGADLALQDSGGWTAVMWAVRNGDSPTLTELIDAGAALDAHDKFSTTALILAARDGRTEAVQLLVDRGANLNSADEDGRTSTMQAARNGYVDALCVIIVAGAQLNVVDNDGRTAAYWAAARDKVECLLALVEARADLDVQDKEGRTAVMFAAENGLFRVLQALLEGGALLNVQDARGRTAAMLAADSGHTVALKMLIEAGADVNSMRNREGQTAVDVAGRHVIKALIEADPTKLFPGGNRAEGNYLQCLWLLAVRAGRARLGAAACW